MGNGHTIGLKALSIIDLQVNVKEAVATVVVAGACPLGYWGCILQTLKLKRSKTFIRLDVSFEDLVYSTV